MNLTNCNPNSIYNFKKLMCLTARTERVVTTGTPHFDPLEPFITFLKRIISPASDSMNCRFQPDFEIVDRLKVQKGLSEVLALLQLELANLLDRRAHV